jgi:hypothetical protein
MCTLTFIPKSGGYLLGMNRDESVRREKALLPVAVDKSGMEAAYPCEASTGGTWIAANAAGVTLALLNQNRGPSAGPKLRSRGFVIPSLVHLRTMKEIVEGFHDLDLKGMMPFLLAGFFPDEKMIAEWKWDGSLLQLRPWTWRPRGWFSSGISDSIATQVRGAFCQDAWRRRDAGSPDWLRRVHASHAPVRGSFSVCVHRPEAESVSYTEVEHSASQTRLQYHAGRPCEALGQFDKEIVFRPPQVFFAAS